LKTIPAVAETFGNDPPDFFGKWYRMAIPVLG